VITSIVMHLDSIDLIGIVRYFIACIASEAFMYVVRALI